MAAAEEAKRRIKALASLAGLSENDAVDFVMLAVVVGRLKQQIAQLEEERGELEGSPLRCLGTPSWRRYLRADDTIVRSLRLVHGVDVDECPYCGKRPPGKTRLRPYVRQESRDEALQAVANQGRLELLIKQMAELSGAAEDVGAFVATWSELNNLLKESQTDEEAGAGE